MHMFVAFLASSGSLLGHFALGVLHLLWTWIFVIWMFIILFGCTPRRSKRLVKPAEKKAITQAGDEAELGETLNDRLADRDEVYSELPDDMQLMVDPIMEAIDSLVDLYDDDFATHTDEREKIDNLLDDFFSVVATWREGERQMALDTTAVDEYVATRFQGLNEVYGVEPVKVTKEPAPAETVDDAPANAGEEHCPECALTSPKHMWDCSRARSTSSGKRVYPKAPIGPAPGATSTSLDFHRRPVKPIYRIFNGHEIQICDSRANMTPLWDADFNEWSIGWPAPRDVARFLKDWARHQPAPIVAMHITPSLVLGTGFISENEASEILRERWNDHLREHGSETVDGCEQCIAAMEKVVAQIRDIHLIPPAAMASAERSIPTELTAWRVNKLDTSDDPLIKVTGWVDGKAQELWTTSMRFWPDWNDSEVGKALIDWASHELAPEQNTFITPDKVLREKPLESLREKYRPVATPQFGPRVCKIYDTRRTYH